MQLCPPLPLHKSAAYKLVLYIPRAVSLCNRALIRRPNMQVFPPLPLHKSAVNGHVLNQHTRNVSVRQRFAKESKGELGLPLKLHKSIPLLHRRQQHMGTLRKAWLHFLSTLKHGIYFDLFRCIPTLRFNVCFERTCRDTQEYRTVCRWGECKPHLLQTWRHVEM